MGMSNIPSATMVGDHLFQCTELLRKLVAQSLNNTCSVLLSMSYTHAS
uniref:Uncharacterized protein n=1 Tax=Arundo donax TaxID=35708 RepID=A0A0A9G4L4_ARUDO